METTQDRKINLVSNTPNTFIAVNTILQNENDHNLFALFVRHGG